MYSIASGKGIAVILIMLLAGAGVGAFIIAPVVFAEQQQQQNMFLQYAFNGYQLSGTLYITGSTTVFPITQAMIPSFNTQYPLITIQALGTGSGSGYSSVINGQSNIAAVSRPPTSSEISLATANGVKLVGWTIGADAICIIYNPSVGVPLNLTAQQVKQIFEAAAQNEGSIPWSNYVPGASGTITAFSRESGSGTRGDFQGAFNVDNTIMNGALVASSNGQMVSDVETTSGGVGYIGLAYDLTLQIAQTAKIAYNSTYDYLAPNLTNVKNWALGQLINSGVYNGTGYFACRFIYYLTNGFPARGSLADRWLGYVLSPAGQAVVDATGYVSMQTIGYLLPAQQWN